MRLLLPLLSTNELSPLNHLEGADAASVSRPYSKTPLTKKQRNNRKKAKAAKVARRKNRK